MLSAGPNWMPRYSGGYRSSPFRHVCRTGAFRKAGYADRRHRSRRIGMTSRHGQRSQKGGEPTFVDPAVNGEGAPKPAVRCTLMEQRDPILKKQSRSAVDQRVDGEADNSYQSLKSKADPARQD